MIQPCKPCSLYGPYGTRQAGSWRENGRTDPWTVRQDCPFVDPRVCRESRSSSITWRYWRTSIRYAPSGFSNWSDVFVVPLQNAVDRTRLLSIFAVRPPASIYRGRVKDRYNIVDLKALADGHAVGHQYQTDRDEPLQKLHGCMLNKVLSFVRIVQLHLICVFVHWYVIINKQTVIFVLVAKKGNFSSSLALQS